MILLPASPSDPWLLSLKGPWILCISDGNRFLKTYWLSRWTKHREGEYDVLSGHSSLDIADSFLLLASSVQRQYWSLSFLYHVFSKYSLPNTGSFQALSTSCCFQEKLCLWPLFKAKGKGKTAGQHVPEDRTASLGFLADAWGNSVYWEPDPQLLSVWNQNDLWFW